MANKLVEYVKGARAELKKVQWPSKRDTRNHTILVIVLAVAVAAFLGMVDFGLNIVLERLIG